MRLRPVRLVLLGLSIVVASVGVALLVHHTNISRTPAEIAERLLALGRTAEAERLLLDAVRRRADDRELWHLLIHCRASRMLEAGAKDSEPVASEPSEDQFLRLLEGSPYADLPGRYRWALGNGAEALRLLQGTGPLGRFAIARGDFAYERREYEEALNQYRAAFQASPESPETVAALLRGLEAAGRRSSIRDYLKKESFLRLAPARHRIEGLLARGEYAALLRPLLEEQAQSFRVITLVIVLFAGAGWAVLLLQIGNVGAFNRTELALIVPALLLGALSAQATLWVGTIQDHIFGFSETKGGFVGTLAFAFLGVGLREELLKLVFFAPLIPFLLRSREDRELRMLVFAGLVGLGFAMEENVSYFGADPSSVFARFMTANFLHLALTGLAGRHLVRILTRPTNRTADFEVIGLVILIHGAYDFLLMERSLGELSILAVTVFIWIAHQFLTEVLALGGRRRRALPLSYNFTAALAFGIGGGYILATVHLGPVPALFAVAGGVLGTAVIAVLFFREFD